MSGPVGRDLPIGGYRRANQAVEASDGVLMWLEEDNDSVSIFT